MSGPPPRRRPGWVLLLVGLGVPAWSAPYPATDAALSEATPPPPEEPTSPPSEEPTSPPSEEPTSLPPEEPTSPPSEEPTPELPGEPVDDATVPGEPVPSTSDAAAATPPRPPAAVVPPPPAALGPGVAPEALRRVHHATRHLPLADRIDALSRALHDRPYRDDPAGEGEGHDPDPPGRYDAFDCLTFVEEVLALAWAATPGGAGAYRHALRYGDHPAAYAHRHHFMELQWLPEAVEAGLLAPLTPELPGATTMAREVTPETWQRWWGRRRFAMPDEALPTGTMQLDVLPLSEARTQALDWPEGTLLMTVRIDNPPVPLWITHVGLLVRGEDGRLKVRHASRMRSARRVREHDLEHYLGLLETYTNWPVAGVSLYRPLEQGPRRGRP